MSFIADLAPYDYLDDAPPALAVGWLDPSQPFTGGTCPRDVRDRLVALAREPRHTMRGFHDCLFCFPDEPRDHMLQVEDPNQPGSFAWLGHAEIWVVGADGTNYAAPTLVVHYIDEHDYLPPASFIEAVRRSG